MVNVSIITPAFNVQDYIEKFIISVQKQKYTDWELIIIDDGSTDSTPMIIDEFSVLDERIKVYHKKNEGVGVARNIGIKMAKGKYVIFADSDDELAPGSLENRVKRIQGYDMAIAAYATRDMKRQEAVKMQFPFEAKYLNQREALVAILRGDEFGYQGYLWNKIFLLDIIKKNNLRFEKSLAYNEDRLFCILYTLHCKHIMVSNEIVYIYLLNENGAMSQLTNITDNQKEKFMSEFVAYEKMFNALNGYDTELGHLCALDAQERAIRLYKNIPHNCIKIRKELKEKIREFGLMTFGASFYTLSIKKYLKVVAHTLLKR